MLSREKKLKANTDDVIDTSRRFLPDSELLDEFEYNWVTLLFLLKKNIYIYTWIINLSYNLQYY